MKWLSLIVVALVLAACGGSGSDDTLPRTVANFDTGAPVATDGHRSATMADGTELAYTLVLPDGFDASKTYPVLLALPPGGQDQETTDNVADGIWKPEAKKRGWIVISPVAPGALFYDPASAKYIPELVA